MPAFFEVGLTYQIYDEILETRVGYWDSSSSSSISPADLQNLCETTIARLKNGDLPDLLGNPWVFYGCTVTTPKELTDNKGPSRFIVSDQDAIGLGASTFNEAGFFNWQLRGTNVLGKPVVSGIRLSGIPEDKIECNTLDETYRADMETALDELFPNVIQVLGQPFNRAVVHRSKDLANPTVVLLPNQSLSNRIGVDITRRGNRAQARGNIVQQPEATAKA